MRVSFVIPTLNQAPFLRTCIDGCRAQGVTDSEILVVDGGSSDGTREILESYGERIRWISERDRGQSDAINKGIRMARGEVVAWVNSDDYYPHGAVLGPVLEAFESDPELDVVYGDGQLVDTSHRPIRLLRPRPPLDARRILLFAGAAVSQPSVFFRRALFLAVGGVDERLHFTMDYDLWIRMFERARKVRYLPEVLSCTTSHAGAKTVQGMLRQIAEVGQVKLRHMGRFRLTPMEKGRLAAGWASMYLYWAAVRVGLKRAS
jgi:glycosyltransferase involved in cell wall biosynthesis